MTACPAVVSSFFMLSRTTVDTLKHFLGDQERYEELWRARLARLRRIVAHPLAILT